MIYSLQFLTGQLCFWLALGPNDGSVAAFHSVAILPLLSCAAWLWLFASCIPLLRGHHRWKSPQVSALLKMHRGPICPDLPDFLRLWAIEHVQAWLQSAKQNAKAKASKLLSDQDVAMSCPGDEEWCWSKGRGPGLCTGMGKATPLPLMVFLRACIAQMISCS